jgi:isopentenyldiphosphate isomerase
MEKINIIDEAGNILGEEYRDVVHERGLLHAEVHVWCVTPEQEIIFQHRAPDKDTFPDKLDATAGGHVDLGETYEEAALKELVEETGVCAQPDELTLITTEILTDYDSVTKLTNHTRRAVYVYTKPVQVAELEIEEGKAVGFEAVSVSDLNTFSKTEKERFIPRLVDENGRKTIDKIIANL